MLILAVGFVAGNSQYSAAQTTPLVDYDLDDDNLIEVRTAAQFQAIHHDLDGDGSPVTLSATNYNVASWASAFPNSMPNAGCPLRDHDNNAQTADARQCLGYELLADVTYSGNNNFVPLGKDGFWGAAELRAKIVGNGFRVIGPRRGGQFVSGLYYGVVARMGIGSSVEGLGVVNPYFVTSSHSVGGMTAELKGTITGSYVQGGQLTMTGHQGGMAGRLSTGNATATEAAYAGKILHSYVRGTSVGSSNNTGGLVGTWNANSGTNIGLCVNSYFSGNVSGGSNHGLIAGQKSGGTVTNCVADSSTDGDNEPVWGGASNADNTAYRATNANMVAVTAYNTPATNPFNNWEDYTEAGVALGSSATRTDFWNFGDGSNLPVHKYWGHDRTLARARTQSGTQTVNLCTRTIAVANEIIRHLKDNVRAPGITTTPAAVTALTDCTQASDTRNVSITNLTNLVYTTESNPFRLDPDRTSPASAQLSALDPDDFAYLTNARHFNLSGNSFTTLPNRLFQAVPVQYLDLSDNALTSLPADLFAGIGSVTATDGNMLFLNGNALTYTGIADRVFDPLTFLNGLDMSDNALTQINTRWFEKLVNLGRRSATATAFRDKLGLHLSGNTITRHFYSTKQFTGVIEDAVNYTGPTAADSLHTAIKAAITVAAGGTTPTTLDIDSAEHFDNTAGTPAYLGANDVCPTTGTAGPAGYDYFGVTAPDCYVSPKWSPPYVSGATTAQPAALTGVSYPDVITVSTAHTVSSTFIAYQVRYRATPSNPADAWTQDWAILPISLDAGTKTLTLSGLTVNTAYQIQMRALSNAAGPSTERLESRSTLTTPAAPTGLTATTSTTAAASVELSWTALTVDPGTTESYDYRQKLNSSSSWGSWTPIAGSDYQTNSLQRTGLTVSTSYDFQIRFNWTSSLTSSASATATATSSGVPTPTNFNAVPGVARAQIDLSWDAVTGATGYQYRCNPAGTSCMDTWQSAGTGTTHAVTGLMPGESYSLELRATIGTGTGEQSTAATDTATAQTQPGPQNLQATTGTNPGEINVSWNAPTGTIARYEYRYKRTAQADSEYTTWAQVDDANSDGDRTNDTTQALTGLLGATEYTIQVRVVVTLSATEEDESLAVSTTHTTSPVPAPTGFMAAAGTNPGTVGLSWSAVTNALRYELRSRRGMGDWTDWTGIGTTTTHTATGLFGGSSHTFELRTFMTGAGASVAVSASATPPVLGAPLGFRARTGALPGEIDLAWSAVTGATGFEYRVKTTSENWPAEDAWMSITGASTISLTLSGLTPGVSHDVELRAVAGSVGTSAVRESVATSQTDEVTGDATLPDGYSIATGTLPGIITITIPPSTNPFIYRTRTSDSGAWSAWTSVRPAATDTQHDIPDLTPGVEYYVELRAYLGADDGFSAALSVTGVEALELDGPADFTVSVSSGTLVLRWTNPNSLDALRYEYRQRAAGTATWSDWTSVDHEGARDSQQQLFIPGLESGVEYSFEMRIQTSAGVSPVSTAGATSRVSLPEIQRIVPEVREVTVRAGDQVRLGVNLYNLQDRLDNAKATAMGALLVFRWTEVGAGGGTFGTPNNARQVAYTAPSSPGNYTITAEAQPDGICSTHHDEASAISAANRAPCIATFTIRVTRAPGPIGPQADPINPAGAIPTSMTDASGNPYAVFTPAEGGTFRGDGFTVSAAAGAVPDRSLLGVSATISLLPPSPPVPGAGMTVAGNYYDVNGINQDGGQPLSDYSLDDPLTVCLPFPNEFRADLSDVVVVSRGVDGALSILTTKVRTNSGVLTVCGAVSALPSTVAVAKLGAVVIPTATPTPTVENPDAGGTAPTAAVLALTLLLGVLLLTGISRMGGTGRSNPA